MADTTRTQVTDAVNSYFHSQLLARAYPHLVHMMWAQVKDVPRNNTNAIRFRRYTNLSAATTALTEGVTPSADQLAITNVDATVAQYGAYVRVTDFLSMTVIEDLHREIANLLGDQAGDTLDQLTRDVLVAGSTIQYASTSTSRATVLAGMVLNGDEVREAVRTLQGNNAKTVTEQIN